MIARIPNCSRTFGNGGPISNWFRRVTWLVTRSQGVQLAAHGSGRGQAATTRETVVMGAKYSEVFSQVAPLVRSSTPPLYLLCKQGVVGSSPIVSTSRDLPPSPAVPARFGERANMPAAHSPVELG
jgi:hypothetical protein